MWLIKWRNVAHLMNPRLDWLSNSLLMCHAYKWLNGDEWKKICLKGQFHKVFSMSNLQPLCLSVIPIALLSDSSILLLSESCILLLSVSCI